MNVTLFLEIKNEYTEHLVDTLTPFLYEGLSSLYNESVLTAEKSDAKNKTLLIFQKFLTSVNNWNQYKIDEETKRIKQASNTSEYLDDLVKAVVKSNIILLAYSNTISNIVGQTFYNNFSTATFIHRCYTECAKDAHNNPYLFLHDVNPMDLKRNQIMIQQNIQRAIIRAVRKILPISTILKEYLINSINIINEPAQVELVHTTKNEKIVNNESKLEKEFLQIIKTENLKSDKQKIQAIMNIDKLISSIDNKPKIISSEKIIMEKTNSQNKNNQTNPNENEPRKYININLNKSDQEVINIKFDNQKTISDTKHDSVSITSLPKNPIIGGKVEKNNLFLTSEKVNPDDIKFIEDYGVKNNMNTKK